MTRPTQQRMGITAPRTLAMMRPVLSNLLEKEQNSYINTFINSKGHSSKVRSHSKGQTVQGSLLVPLRSDASSFHCSSISGCSFRSNMRSRTAGLDGSPHSCPSGCYTHQLKRGKEIFLEKQILTIQQLSTPCARQAPEWLTSTHDLNTVFVNPVDLKVCLS